MQIRPSSAWPPAGAGNQAPQHTRTDLPLPSAPASGTHPPATWRPKQCPYENEDECAAEYPENTPQPEMYVDGEPGWYPSPDGSGYDWITPPRLIYPQPDGAGNPSAEDPHGRGETSPMPGPAGPADSGSDFGAEAPPPDSGPAPFGWPRFPLPDVYPPGGWPGAGASPPGGGDGAPPVADAPSAPPPAALPPTTPHHPQPPGSAGAVPEHLQELHQQVLEQLRAEQAREESLLDPDAFMPVGVRGQARPIVPVRNGQWDHALNLAADPAGILAPLTELQASLGRLSQQNAERQIEDMRQQMRQAGVPNVPEGYQMAWVTGGRMVRDYAATAQQLNDHYQSFLQDQRLTQSWGRHWRDIRLGHQHMTVPQFEQHMLDLQQRTADQAYTRALDLHRQGRLPMPLEGRRNPVTALNVAVGIYIDEQVRAVLRRELNNLGLQDSPHSPLAAINRRITDPATGRYGLPDMRLGPNLYADTTLQEKHPDSRQIRNWHAIQPGHYLIIRPDAVGGAYALPPANIRPPRARAHKPGI